VDWTLWALFRLGNAGGRSASCSVSVASPSSSSSDAGGDIVWRVGTVGSACVVPL